MLNVCRCRCPFEIAAINLKDGGHSVVPRGSDSKLGISCALSHQVLESGAQVFARRQCGRSDRRETGSVDSGEVKPEIQS